MTDHIDEGSISRWMTVLRTRGEVAAHGGLAPESVEAAARALWQRYFRRMVGLARLKLQNTRGNDAAVDGEDIALSAFESFCGGAANGRFPDLFDRGELWRLLVVITTRKAYSEARRQNRQRRGSGLVRNFSDVQSLDDGNEDELLARAVGTEPTPESAATMIEEYQRLLDRLGDETLQQVALWKMEGHTNNEIAERLGCARRTVSRQLALIRTIWLSGESASASAL